MKVRHGIEEAAITLKRSRRNVSQLHLKPQIASNTSSRLKPQRQAPRKNIHWHHNNQSNDRKRNKI